MRHLDRSESFLYRGVDRTLYFEGCQEFSDSPDGKTGALHALRSVEMTISKGHRLYFNTA